MQALKNSGGSGGDGGDGGGGHSALQGELHRKHGEQGFKEVMAFD